MRPLLLTILLAAVSAAPASAEVDVSKTVMEPYLRIQASLVNDKFAGVTADAARIADGLRSLGPNTKDARDAATTLAGAADITAARTAFARLSDALIAFAEKGDATFGDNLNVAYCPMVKQHWIQKGTEIANPYGGQKMPRCGEIVKPLE